MTDEVVLTMLINRLDDLATDVKGNTKVTIETATKLDYVVDRVKSLESSFDDMSSTLNEHMVEEKDYIREYFESRMTKHIADEHSNTDRDTALNDLASLWRFKKVVWCIIAGVAGLLYYLIHTGALDLLKVFFG
jgi:hypothetical protein